MKAVVMAVLLTTTVVFAMVNPNSPVAEKAVDSLREVPPSPEVKKITLKEVQTINTKGNYWTVVILPFEDGEYLVGNEEYYEVRKEKNKFFIRPKRQFVNSDITVIRGNQIYKFILSQSRQMPDLIVRVELPKPPDYEAEVEAFLKGEDPKKLKHIKVEAFKEGKKYDKVVYYKGKKWGIRYVR